MLSTFPRLAFAGLTLFCSAQSQASEPTPATAPEKNLIAQGKYIAQLGDCIACHTAKGGAVMAGGLELKTPMGTIYRAISPRILKPASASTALNSSTRPCAKG
jgi:hypothetical protein